ncbi:amino acid permease [Nannocystis sp. SCPEA4]|uniref:APC family permease n=1 Tax=Nannocystis sp. SCPEA4 TaxID=2996787 RepID=UPI00226F8168|nr:amino acid permease [Nannocystis sp. SCPEA4]MCY1056033.1 amino acid permease [Nannocystis sp. SCPEA4]
METRHLGRWAAQALVAGSMLGIGIFISPPVVATHVQSPLWFLALWLAGGLAALCGALCVAELGAMMPRAGGEYPYLRAAYGPGIAFATGWLQLLATFPGSLAAMAVGTTTFQLPVLLGPSFAAPVDLGVATMEGPTFWAIALVVGLTALNHIGIVLSGRVQLVVTVIPLAVLLAVSLFVVGDIGTVEVSRESLRVGLSPGPSAAEIAQAYLPIYFAYSGWNAAIYIGGEIADPGKNLPRAVVGGTAMVAVLYFVLCAGYLAVFDMSALAGAGEAGTAAAGALFGHAGVIVVTLMILLAMLGSINGTVMAGSRIAYAMAGQRHCFTAAGQLSPRFGTPVVALWLQAALATALILSRQFDQLMDYAAAAMLISGSLAVASVIALRRKDPEHPRPYRLGFYPWAPLIYIGSSVFVLGALAVKGDLSVLMAAGWFALALLFHGLVVAPRLR